RISRSRRTNSPRQNRMSQTANGHSDDVGKVFTPALAIAQVSTDDKPEKVTGSVEAVFPAGTSPQKSSGRIARVRARVERLRVAMDKAWQEVHVRVEAPPIRYDYSTQPTAEGDAVMSEISREEIESRFREQEAKTEKRFAELVGEMRTSNAE